MPHAQHDGNKSSSNVSCEVQKQGHANLTNCRSKKHKSFAEGRVAWHDVSEQAFEFAIRAGVVIEPAGKSTAKTAERSKTSEEFPDAAAPPNAAHFRQVLISGGFLGLYVPKIALLEHPESNFVMKSELQKQF